MNNLKCFCCKIAVFLIPLLLSVLSCEKESDQVMSANDYQSEMVLSECFVNIDKVYDFAESLYPRTKGDKSSGFTVSPILGKEQDTLMYIVNFGIDRGWMILSADSRTPAMIAESDRGSFSLTPEYKGLHVWMDGVSKNLEMIRHSGDEVLAFSKEEIAANKSFWQIDGTRAQDPPMIDPGGEWRVTTSIETIVSDSLEHMTPHWYQRQPYNDYCPYKTDGSGERAKAGCVAVSGAQVLYYLHRKYGIPQTMVSAGYCIGDINGFTREFYNPTSTVWASMDTTCHYESGTGGAETMLIGHIGDLVGTNYHNTYSWALPAQLRTNVFEWYGYSCSHGNYDEDVVKASLENNLPVIITATDLLIPLDGDIHTFVIDGYKKSFKQYTYHHYWVPSDPDNYYISPDHPDYFTYACSSPEITHVKMNWGWDSQWHPDYLLNDGWYSLTENWIVNAGTEDEHDYNYYRQMIYGFSITE